VRMRRSGLPLVAAELAVPVALGILIGGVLSYQAGSTNNLVQPVPLGAVATPTPSFGQPSSTATGAVAPPSPGWLTPTATPAATPSSVVKQTPTATASGR
jgi:hypothetical protein